MILKPLSSNQFFLLKKREKRLTAARIEAVTKFFKGERAGIELSTPSSLPSWRAVWKQLTCINETEARAVSCDVITVTSHFESFGSILGHFPTFATPSALYQWSCLGLPYRAVGCILYRSVTPFKRKRTDRGLLWVLERTLCSIKLTKLSCRQWWGDWRENNKLWTKF